MFEVHVLAEYCKGCKLCVSVCPKHIMVMSDQITSRGSNIASCSDASLCTGCSACAVICPDAAIEIHKTVAATP